MADRRIGAGPLLALLGAGLTAVSLWLHWYSVDFTAQIRDAFRSQGGGALGDQLGSALGEAFAQGFGKAFNGLLPSSIAGNGWEVLHTFDILLLAGALAVAAIAVFGDALGVDRATAARLMRLAGVALGALVVYKMFDRTGPHEFVKLAAGPWVALAGCVLMTAGGIVGLPANASAPVVFAPPVPPSVPGSVAPPGR